MTTDKSRADALTAQVALAAIETFETGREYRFDGAVPNAKRDGVLPAWWRRPSIFMPSTAARTLFEVPGVCVERLQSISDVNAISEGIERTSDGFSVDGSRHFPAARARDSFASLWGSINAEAGHGGGTRTRSCGSSNSEGSPRVMAIDQYAWIADNLAAVAATRDAMRGIERRGGARILERAFTGFATLAAPGRARHWREVIGMPLTEQLDRPAVVRGDKECLYVFTTKFGTRTTRTTDSKDWRLMNEAIEAKVIASRFTFHDLRAYYATQFKRESGALPDLHANPATTARVYDRNKIVKRKAL
ncbi:hypothetical protein [Burkholderia cenocepacia]|uniref:hypothetical protein n=1 Tax=Burkholderia cenocepacia TaxID=95486 RepID=UPI002010E1D5|nr:hypothetical protein [Burkholderia cenocepacia]